MAVSIINRATGVGLAVAGGLGFIWWLAAAASGADAYATFLHVATSWFGYLVAVGLTWSFFQHMCGGLRHFLLDTGAGYELRINRIGAIGAMIAPIVLTLLVWAPALLTMTRH